MPISVTQEASLPIIGSQAGMNTRCRCCTCRAARVQVEYRVSNNNALPLSRAGVTLFSPTFSTHVHMSPATTCYAASGLLESFTRRLCGRFRDLLSPFRYERESVVGKAAVLCFRQVLGIVMSDRIVQVSRPADRDNPIPLHAVFLSRWSIWICCSALNQSFISRLGLCALV